MRIQFIPRTIKCRWIAVLLIVGVLPGACSRHDPASEELYRAVDELYGTVLARTGRFQVIAEIDHSRLAAAEGEVMPPARVVIFSDPAINTPILQEEPLAGLDLPFRVLAYSEEGSPAVTFTNAEFLQHRHGLADGPALQQYQKLLLETVSSVPEKAMVNFDASPVGKGEGIVTLNSRYDFDQTIARLKDAILEEDDTVWFGEIDYRKDAAMQGVDLPRLTLLLWGAPAPGAKAMREFPRMGLDAFCQKTLVYQPPGEEVLIYYNEMPAFAKIHYGDTALPHRVISSRMLKMLEGAVEGENL
jgi:uncharacterized protein (DUF302 family)